MLDSLQCFLPCRFILGGKSSHDLSVEILRLKGLTSDHKDSFAVHVHTVGHFVAERLCIDRRVAIFALTVKLFLRSRRLRRRSLKATLGSGIEYGPIQAKAFCLVKREPKTMSTRGLQHGHDLKPSDHVTVRLRLCSRWMQKEGANQSTP